MYFSQSDNAVTDVPSLNYLESVSFDSVSVWRKWGSGGLSSIFIVPCTNFVIKEYNYRRAREIPCCLIPYLVLISVSSNVQTYLGIVEVSQERFV